MSVNVTVKKFDRVRVPVFINKYDKWYVATAPQLDLVTKGRTIEEAKENIADLLNVYFEDPYTVKPKPENLVTVDITFIPVNIPQGVSHTKAKITS